MRQAGFGPRILSSHLLQHKNISFRHQGSSMSESQTVESIFARQYKIYSYVLQGKIDEDLLNNLIINGRAVNDESCLWDFKRSLPVLPTNKVNQFLKENHDSKIHEIVKDCVAFYNSFGGYLIIGVDDSTRAVVGFSSDFDAADLNKRIHGATGNSIETVYRKVKFEGAGPNGLVGVIFIPKRPESIKPVQFRKNAPANDKGTRAYSQHDFYMRERDICRKTVSSDDYEFLFGPRAINPAQLRSNSLDHNLPPRDYDLGHLYGRDSELMQLWSWLSDAFSPVKILCGLGGVGKTSIAYTFAERLSYSAPPYINKLVWLGAKERSFAPLLGKEIELVRVDFTNIDELLIALLLEIGCPKDQLPEVPATEELMEMTQTHLSEYSYILIVDNVDTLPDDEQQQIFHILTQLCAVSKTKAVITARRNLGASRLLYTEIEGLSFDDFRDFVMEKISTLKLGNPIGRNSKEMRSFFDASGGSPLFALSVLRFAALGDSMSEAIDNWRGSDGETVRKAAFQREVDRLDAVESKVLLVLCYLGQASVLVIANILKLTRYQVQNALERLQAFSMTGIDRSLPSGAIFKVPPTLALVASLIERRVIEHKAINQECMEHVDLTKNQGPFVADVISKAMAHIRDHDCPEALVVALNAIGILPDNGDLHCLLGRIYSVLDDTRAEDSYQKAYDLGCLKRELFDGWINFRQNKENWTGVISISHIGERQLNSARYSISRHHAEMMIADQFSQAGQYKEAEQSYEISIKSIRHSIAKYRSTPDSIALKNLKDGLVVRWLGSVRMLTSKYYDSQRRYIGATHKAVVVYKISNSDVFRYATSAMLDWIERIADRSSVSETAKDQLAKTCELIGEMDESISKRTDIPESIRTRFADDAKKIKEKTDYIISKSE